MMQIRITCARSICGRESSDYPSAPPCLPSNGGLVSNEHADAEPVDVGDGVQEQLRAEGKSLSENTKILVSRVCVPQG